MTGGEVDTVEQRSIVVTALPLRREARERLAELLGARVVDVREPVDRVDLVVTPPCSPQLIGALKAKYDGARIVVVELDDADFDVELGGPVKRILRGGANGYLLADSLEELADKLLAPARAEDAREAIQRELTHTAEVDSLIAALLRESEGRVEIGEMQPRPD